MRISKNMKIYTGLPKLQKHLKSLRLLRNLEVFLHAIVIALSFSLPYSGLALHPTLRLKPVQLVFPPWALVVLLRPCGTWLPSSSSMDIPPTPSESSRIELEGFEVREARYDRKKVHLKNQNKYKKGVSHMHESRCLKAHMVNGVLYNRVRTVFLLLFLFFFVPSS